MNADERVRAAVAGAPLGTTPDPDPEAEFAKVSPGRQILPTTAQITQRAFAPLNTHAIGWTGLGLAAIGLIGPPILCPHLAPSFATPIDTFGRLIAAVGTTAALAGRPFFVPSGP